MYCLRLDDFVYNWYGMQKLCGQSINAQVSVHALFA